MVMLDKFRFGQCSERCKHLNSLNTSSSELYEPNQQLSHQNKSIDDQHIPMKRLLEKLQKTEKSGEEDHIVLTKQKTPIEAFSWLLLALFFLLIGSINAVYVIVQPENRLPPHAQNNVVGWHQFYVRENWGAKPPKYSLKVNGPVDMVIIKHTGSRYCNNFRECASIVSDFQNFSVSLGYPDIYCNFLIGGDGNIYEGRGWGIQPQERNNTVDIVFIGNYMLDDVTASMLNAAQALMKDGVERKFLDQNYIVFCHNQTKNTMSPGTKICEEVVKWPHFDPNLHFEHQLK